ncbi:all2529-like protein, partial [Metarhizium majus ARSEF 297]
MSVLYLTNEFDGSQPIKYYFITFNEKGVERRDSDGKSLSHTVMRLLATSQPRYTDVFIISHGWKSDVQEAARQYKSWIRVMAEMIQDRKKATNKIKGFKALIIGLHRPSLLWGDEQEINDFAESIANTKESRFALRNIISSAHGPEEAGKLPDTVQQAYNILLAESELKTCDQSDCPGAEDPPFNAQTIVDEAKTAQVAPPTGLLGPQLTGTGGLVRIADILMSPLRQLSFRTMKKRARVFGESGGNQLLHSLQDLAPDARFHLVGHSFGCIAVSAMIAGSPGRDDAAQPVHSLFLVQGALSLWSFAKQVPETEGMPGYFHCIMDKRLATEVIRNGSGLSGAHSDIAHPEVAHAFWAAVLAEPVVPGRAPQKARFELLYNKMDEVGKEMEVDEEEVVYEEEEEVDEELVVEEMVVDDEEEESEDEQDERLLRFRGGDLDLEFEVGGSEILGSIRPVSRDKLGYPYPILDFEYPESGAVAQEATPATGRKTRQHGQPLERGLAHRQTERGKEKGDQVSLLYLVSEFEPISLLAPEKLPEAYISEVAMQQRFIRAKIEGEDETCPVLDISYWYRFVIDVDTGESDRGIPAPPLHEVNIFATGTDEVTLTAQLDSDDICIPQNIQEFKLHRKGSLLDKVYFEISPENLGLSKLRLTILKDCNFV